MIARVVPESAELSCDGCLDRIERPSDGAVVDGVISTARVRVERDPTGDPVFVPDGGLVGPSMTAYHWGCLLRVLGWGRVEHAVVTAEDADAIYADVFGPDPAESAPVPSLLVEGPPR